MNLASLGTDGAPLGETFRKRDSGFILLKTTSKIESLRICFFVAVDGAPLGETFRVRDEVDGAPLGETFRNRDIIDGPPLGETFRQRDGELITVAPTEK